MKKKLSIGIGAALFVAILVGIWSSHLSTWFGRSASPKNIKVGVILPLTGGAAALGKPSLKGIQLAVKEYMRSKAPTEPAINLIIEDSVAQPARGVSAFQKLVASHGVKLILGPLPSGVTLAVAPLAERHQVVILSHASSAPSITHAGDYIFRNELSEELGASIQAELAFNRLRYKSVALLYVNNEYGVGTAKVFRETFLRLGGTIVVDEAFNAETTDFRTVLTKIRSRKPDAIFVVFQDDIVNIIKQRAELGIATAIYTTPVFETPDNLRKLGPLAEGIIYSYYGTFDQQAQSGVAANFVRHYKNEYGEAPTYYAALAYDAARILLTSLRASDFDQTQVKDALYNVKDFDGVTGKTTFDSKGDVRKPVSLKTVRDGKFVLFFSPSHQ